MIANRARLRRTVLGVVALGLITASCGGAASSDATAPGPTSSADVPAATAEVDEASSNEIDATNETPDAVGDAPAPTSADEPMVSPLFEGDFVDLNGSAVDLAAFEGHDVVVWFWAPW